MKSLKERLKIYGVKKKYTVENLMDVLSNTVVTKGQFKELRRRGFQIGK